MFQCGVLGVMKKSGGKLIGMGRSILFLKMYLCDIQRLLSVIKTIMNDLCCLDVRRL